MGKPSILNVAVLAAVLVGPLASAAAIAARPLTNEVAHVPPLRLSIFAGHVEDIARQEHVSFSEAAEKIRAFGIEGIVLTEGFAAEKLAAARRAGLAVSCVVGWPAFEKGYDEAQCEALVALAVSNGCRQVMLVPGYYPSAEDSPLLFAEIVRRTERFAAKASAHGVETLVEDFDDERSPTFGLARTKAFLAAAPSVGFVYDTGNFIGRGERAEDALGLLPRTRHFHLKDRPAGNTRGTCAVGSGTVPIAAIVSAALADGYSGWFTIEHFGATNMLECARSSAAYLRDIR